MNNHLKPIALAFFCLGVLTQLFAQPVGDTGQRIRISQGPRELGTYIGASGTPANASPAVVPVNSATPLTFQSLDADPATIGNRLCSVPGDGTEAIHITDGNC